MRPAYLLIAALISMSAAAAPIVQNIWTATENLASPLYSTTNGAKDPKTVAFAQGIRLGKFASSNMYGSLWTNMQGVGFKPFIPGKKYLLSEYVSNQRDGEQLIWMRDYTADKLGRGHAGKLVTQEVRRIWTLVQATAPDKVDVMSDPTVPLGKGAPSNPYWVFTGSTGGQGDVDLRIGGFQAEQVPDDTKVGVALIGDSTMAGSSALHDAANSREVSTYLGAFLNVPVFNRAVGGQRTDQMDARWDADITPLAANSKYAVIQGGINDIGQGRTLVEIQGSISSMVGKAVRDGLIPVVLTCTPTVTIGADPVKEQERQDLNAWMMATFPNAIDIAPVVTDSSDPAHLNPDPLWYGDGTHYLEAAKHAVAVKLAQWPGWKFVQPSTYRPVSKAS